MDGLESWVSLFFYVSLLSENVRKLESMDYLFSFATGDYPYLPRLFIYFYVYLFTLFIVGERNMESCWFSLAYPVLLRSLF